MSHEESPRQLDGLFEVYYYSRDGLWCLFGVELDWGSGCVLHHVLTLAVWLESSFLALSLSISSDQEQSSAGLL